MNLNQIESKLKELRIKKNITQEELAKQLYLSRQAVSRWETGKSIPDYQTLISICEFYNVNINYFFEDNNLQDKKSYFDLILENFNKQKTKHEQCFYCDTYRRWVSFLPVFFASKL